MKTKKCKTCNTTQDVENFYFNGNRRNDGSRIRQGSCKACHNAKMKAHREANRDTQRGYKLLKAFGLSLEDYNGLLARQGGVCAICGITPEQNRKALAVDHDHACCPTKGKSCGKCIRGLLCAKCNYGLGQFGDSRELLARASDYLDK